MNTSSSPSIITQAYPDSRTDLAQISPVRTVLLFATLGWIWIWVTDWLLFNKQLEIGDGFLASGVKGTLFIVVSSGLLYWLLRRDVQAIGRATSLLEAVLDETTDAVFVKDLKGRYLLANNATKRIVGVDDIVGKVDSDFFDPAGAQQIFENDRRVMESAEVQTAEEHLVSAGITRWFQAIKAPLRDSNGNVVGLIGISRDITAAKENEEKLRHGEERLALALDATTMGVWEWDVVANEVFWSKHCYTIFGLSRPINSLQEFADLVHVDDRDRVVTNAQRAVSERTLFVEEFRIYRPDGTFRWVSNLARGVYDEASGRKRLIGTVLDIHDRRQAAEELRKSEARYRQLVDLLPCSVVVVSEEQITFCNREFARLLGATSPEQIVGRSFFDILHVEFHSLVRKRLEHLAETRRPNLNAEVRLRRLDGHEVLAGIAAAPFGEGEPMPILLVCSDLSGRERADNLLRAMMGSVPDAILTIDSQGTILSINPATQQMFQYSDYELLGKNVKILMPDPHKGNHDQYIQNYLTSGERKIIGTRREMEAVRSDGSRLPIELVITEFLVDGEQRFTGVIRDITDRKNLEEQFRQSQKMEAIGRLAGGVAHDFNNILTIINGYSDLLLDGLDPENSIRASLSAIRTAGERAASLTAQLLAFSRKTVIEPKILDFNEVVRNSKDLLKRLIGEDIFVKVELDATIGKVRADLSQIDQMLMNLVVNARDAMPKGGTIEIRTRSRHVDFHVGEIPPGRYIELVVSDTGSGIPEDIKQNIFEPFFTTKDAGRGSGLGLAVVYGVVRQCGGHIRVSSVVGEGTSFHMYFPTAMEQEGAQLPPEKETRTQGTETILLVEDENEVRKIARIALENQGYKIIEASSGEEALSLANQCSGAIDILVTDVVMPQMGGRELAEALHRQIPNLKILYMSGYTDDSTVRYGIFESVDSFLQKPFTPIGLARKVREVLDRE